MIITFKTTMHKHTNDFSNSQLFDRAHALQQDKQYFWSRQLATLANDTVAQYAVIRWPH